MIKQLAKYVEATPHLIGVNMFVGWRPANAPDDCITILETNGGKPDFYQSDYVEKLFQVITRGTTYFTSRGLSLAMYNKMHALKGVTLTTVDAVSYYVNTSEALQYPTYIGQDEKGRFEFSTNYLFKIQNS